MKISIAGLNARHLRTPNSVDWEPLRVSDFHAGGM